MENQQGALLKNKTLQNNIGYLSMFTKDYIVNL